MLKYNLPSEGVRVGERKGDRQTDRGKWGKKLRGRRRERD